MRALRSWLLLCLCLLGAAVAGAAAGPPRAALITIQGAIGPATSLYVRDASRLALARGDRLIILQLDTPGGLDEPMRDIIKSILASPVPVVAWVAPPGARAASAGTYLLYASHVAAMAPATNLGAATPIPVLGDAPVDARGGDEAPQPASAVARKAVNDASAYLRSLAEKRGRNAEWAEQAVRQGASLSADAALRLKVIDLVAPDRQSLLRQLDGRHLAWDDHRITLATRDMVVESIAPTWRQGVLAVITNPAVAYLLMLIGVYGLLLEGFSPGAILPGVLGAICLLVALYAFQVLPINYAGLGLIVLGIALIVAETTVPSAGVLGAGGVVAFVAGSLLMLDSDIPGYRVPLGLIGGIATAASLLVLLSLGLLWRSRRRPALQAAAGLAGAEAIALEDFREKNGWIEVHGERWRAHCDVPVRRGTALRIVDVQALELRVEPRTPSAGAANDG